MENTFTSKHYKTMMKESKEDIDKWVDIYAQN
jgi:hypothetical protein